jgi:hypothetical protein
MIVDTILNVIGVILRLLDHGDGTDGVGTAGVKCKPGDPIWSDTEHLADTLPPVLPTVFGFGAHDDTPAGKRLCRGLGDLALEFVKVGIGEADGDFGKAHRVGAVFDLERDVLDGETLA